MSTAFLAKLESKIRPLLVRTLPPKATVKLYSTGRSHFMSKLIASPPPPYAPPRSLAVTLWGIPFRSPVLNAAGMFKNGEGYSFVAAQGAGAFMAGTSTANPRKGNSKDGVDLAFAPYPNSHSSSNWLGLPNDGDEAIAARLQHVQRVDGCPLCMSSMGSPDLEGQEKVAALVRGLKRYEEVGVDLLEINESCPNTAHGSPQNDDLRGRLEYIKNEFLVHRQRTLPVVVKFSNDTELEQVADLMSLVIELGFDGVNFGNTSTKYDEHRDGIAAADRSLYEFFTSTYGGGLGGSVLKQKSLRLVEAAKSYVAEHPPSQEFHLVRTGGVESAEDVQHSLAAGASLVQWYTGYFEQFSEHGHYLYAELYEQLVQLRQ